MFGRLKVRKFNIIDLEKLKEMRRRGKYLRYYVKPVRAGRNTLAKNLDFYIITAAVAVTACFMLAGYTGSPKKALVYTLIIMLPAVWLAVKIKKHTEGEEIDHKRLWRAGKLCQQRIKELGSGDKLSGLMMEIMEKMPVFSDVHLLKENDRGNDQGLNISLRALRQGRPLAVGCLAAVENDDRVPAERVAQFLGELERLNIEEGILVSAGDFSHEARRAAREGGKKVTLVDLYRLVELTRLVGHNIFPAQLLPDSEGKSGSQKAYRQRLFRNAFLRNKARGYLAAAAIMTALYFTVIPPGLSGAAYLACAAVNLALSVYCIVSNREPDLLGATGKKH